MRGVPNLVTHVREERALRFRRVFGPALGQLELADERPEGLFRLLALGDVPGRAVDNLLVGERRRRPEEPANRPVLVPVAVFERDHFAAVAERLGLGAGRVAIVGMDEIHVRTPEQLLFGVAEDPVPRRIDAFEVAVESGDAQHVERDVEEAIELLLRAATIEEHADLVADRRERRQQSFIRLADLAAEKLEDALHLAAQQYRKAKGGVQPFTCGDGRARKVRVLRDVRNPGGVT